MNIGIDLRILQSTNFLSKQRFVFSLVSAMLEMDLFNRYVFYFSPSKPKPPEGLSFVNSEDKYIPIYSLIAKITKKDILPIEFRMNDFVIFFDVVDKTLIFDSKVIIIFTSTQSYERALAAGYNFGNFTYIFACSKSLAARIMSEHSLDAKTVMTLRPSVSDGQSLQIPKLENLRSCRSRLGLPADYILYLGEVSNSRNLDFLLECFEDLRSPIDLVIAGPQMGSTQRLFSRFASSQKSMNIHYIGELDNSTKVSVLSLAKIVAIPQVDQDFSLTMQEAFYLGVPVIAAGTEALTAYSMGSCLLPTPLVKSDWVYAINTLLVDHQARMSQVHFQSEVARSYNIKDSAKEVLLSINRN